MNYCSHNKCFPREVNSASWLGLLGLNLLVLLLSACGSESTPLGPNQAMIVIEMPSMKSAARALDTKGSTIPAEITEILFEVADSAGIKIGKEQDFLKVKSVQFPLAAERDYTITGTARSGAITLFKGSETVAALKPGETRNVAVSLLAKIKFALSVTSDLQNPQGSTPDATAPVQWILGQSKAIKVDVEGLDDENNSISWSVNDIPGGDSSVGTVSPQGTYTPPVVVPANPNIRIKAIPTAAPSFAKAVEVTLVPQPGSAELPTSSATPAGGQFASAQIVTLSCLACSAIHFTVDGSEPTLASVTYSNPIAVSTPTVLKFFAVNTIGNAEDTHSESYAFIVPPAAPTNLSATAGDGQIDLAWAPVVGATEYRVFRSTSASVSVLGEPVGAVAATSFKSLGLTNGTAFFFRVVAVNAAGGGEPSVEVNATPMPPKPTLAPTLTATSANSSVSLSWTAVGGATKYHVFRNTGPGVSTLGLPYQILAGTVFSDTGLNNGTNYYYKVAAANLAGLGPDSNEISAQPLPGLPDAPTGLVATAGNAQVQLGWNAVAGASEYRVYRHTAAGVVTTGDPLATVFVAAYTDSNLTNGGTYFYSVVATNQAGVSAAANEVSSTPLPGLPLAPTNLTATAGDNLVTLNWPAVAGATGYEVFRGTSAGVFTSGVLLEPVGPPGYSDSTAINGTTYFYAVRATNLAGPGAPSIEASATPLPPKPAAPVGLAASPNDGQISLSWTPVSGATKYRVFRSTSAGVSTADVAVGEVDAPPFNSIGLTNGNTYYFKVVATNISGDSPDSAEISATPLPILPAAPASFSANAADAQVALSWNVVAGASTYRIFRSTSPGVATGSNATPIDTAITNAYSDTKVVNGTAYYYKVVANNLAGDGPASGETSAKPLPPIPAPPASFVATAGDGLVNLVWGTVSGATEYRLFRSLSPGVLTIGSPYKTVTNTTYADQGLSNGTVYYYKVVAANIAGSNGASSEANAKPLPPLPGAPANFTATAGNAQVTLTWTPVPGAAEYRVYRDTNPSLTPTGAPFDTTLTATYADGAVTNGTTYYYRVVAANLNGPGVASAETSAKPLPPAPGIPINLTATSGDAKVTLNWAPVNGATGYRIYGGTTQAGVLTSGVAIGEVTTPGFTSMALTNGDTYYFKVVAFNIGGAGPDSAEVSAKPLPPLPVAPSNLVAAASDGHVGLSWVAVASATEYRIYRGISPGVITSGAALVTVNTTTHSDLNLINGTIYYYKVVAANVAGPGPESAEVTATPLPSLPSAPTSFTVTAGDGQTSLSWTAANAATEYRIFRGTIAGVDVVGTPIKTLTTTSFVDSGLTNGTAYFYKVLPANVAGIGPASDEMSGTPLPPLPSAPTNFSAVPGDGQVALNWTAANGATEYRVFRGTSAGVPTTGNPLMIVGATSANDSAVINGTTYFYKVVAANIAGMGGSTADVAAKPLPPIPTVPTNVVASAGDGQIALSWPAVTKATEYWVFRDTNPNVSTSGSPVSTVNNTSFTGVGLTNGTAYYFKVVAANVAGPGPASAEVNATPLPPLPVTPVGVAANAGNAQVALSWGAVAGAAEYRIFRSTTAGVATNGTPIGSTNNAFYTDASLINGTTYFYRIVAANLAGPGPSSAEVNAKPLPPLPAAPTNFTANAGNNQVALAWASVPGASEYRVFRATSAGVSTAGTPLTVISTNSITDQGLTNGTTYYYVIVAANLAGSGASSSEVSATPLPPIPGSPLNVNAAAGDTQVTLTWAAVTGATEYRIYRSNSPGVIASGNPITTVNTLTFVNVGLTNGTTYYFKIVAANLAGAGTASTETNAKPLPPLPGVPGSFTATAGDTQVALAWANVTGASEYRIYRGTVAGVSTAGAPLATVGIPSYTNAGLVNGTTYYFRVVAANIAGAGLPSAEATAKPLPPLPTVPGSLTAVAGNAQVALNWQAANNAADYRVYRSTSPGAVSTGSVVATVTGINYTNLALTNGTTYYYAVIATNLAGTGPASVEASATPLPPLPAAPTVFSATAGDAQVALTWAAVNGATEYRIFRGTSAGVSTTGGTIATVNAPSYTNSGLTNGTTYYYRVVAANVAGPSADSPEVSAKPLPPLPAAPANFSATIGNAQVTLSWTAVAGATSYKVYRGTTSGVSTGGVPIGTVTTPSFTSIGLTNGVTYYFRVVATNVAGSGPDSAEVSAKPLPPLPTAPTNLVATAGDAQTTLAWSVVAGASEYRIYRGTTQGVVTSGAPTVTTTNAQYIDLSLTNGTTYFYKVVAANLAGPGPASAEANAKPLPPIPTTAPANFTATAGNTQIGLAWTAVVHATEYRVFRSTTVGVSTAGIPIATVATATFTDQGLTNGTVYYYKVVAANLAGSGPASSEANAKPLPALPAAPASVTATATDAKVALAWPPVNGATGYRIFRSTTTGTATSQPALADVVTAAYTDLAVANGTTYYYQVAATNLAGAGAPSTEVAAKPLPPLPVAPINLVTTPSDGQIGLTWTAANGATGYRVYRSTSPNVSTVSGEVGTVTATSFTSIGLTNGTTYYFKVVATNIAGHSPDSAEVSAIPLPPKPGAPTNLTAVLGNSQVFLTWTAVTGATQYQVFRAASAGVPTTGNPTATVNSPSFTDPAPAGTNYYYKVVATNVAGPGPASAEVAVIGIAPGNLIATFGDTQVALTWTVVAGATEYRIYRSTAPSVVTTGPAFAYVPNTNYTNTGLTNGTTYYYKIVAANLAGPGPASAEVSAKPLPPLPAAPANLTATAGNTQVTLLWSPVIGAAEYHIFRGTASGVVTTGAPLIKVAAITYINTGLINGTTYYYKVVAANLAGSGAPSLEVNAKPVPPLPAAPVNVTATPDSQRVTVNWSTVAGATEYNIYRGTTPNVPAIGVPFAASLKVLPLVDNTVVNNVTYYYKVTAANLAGESPASAEVSARPGVLLKSVTLSDTSLNYCFQNAVAQGNFKFVYELTNLNCGDYYAFSLAGMEQLTELVTVDLHYNQISDVSPLTKIAGLREINLNWNLIKQVPDLSIWPKLEFLDLGTNQITDIDGIGKSGTVSNLNLSRNPLESIHALATWVPQKGLLLDLTETNVVDVTELELVKNLKNVTLQNAPYLSCQSVSHLDKTVDGGNGNAAGIVTWNTCVDLMPNTFTFVDNGSRRGWRHEGLGETTKFTYVTPNPLALTWQKAPVAATFDGLLNITRTLPWPANFPIIQGYLWFDDVVSPVLTYASNWQAMTGVSTRISMSQYKGSLQLQFLLDVTRKSDGVKVNYREIDAKGAAVFHPIPATGKFSTIQGDFSAVSKDYIIDRVRLRIFGDLLGGDVTIQLDDIARITPIVLL